MDFVALDFETANADYSSICQVGIVTFAGGEVVERYSTLVHQKHFDGVNSSIHGITADMVSNAPTFGDVYPEITQRISGRVVLTHSTFDQTALRRAAVAHLLEPGSCRWLDTTRVVRRHWTQFASSGYGLPNVCQKIGLIYASHNAAEDAWAAGMVMIRAIKESQFSLDEWLIRAFLPISVMLPISSVSDPSLTPSPLGALYGSVMVFTGELTLTRREAAQMAALHGCRVDERPTRKTTILVVGVQEIWRLSEGNTKSNKHLRAEELIGEGYSIRIITENDFMMLCEIEAEAKEGRRVETLPA